jgi:hemoglobin-like flavoprotein
MTPGDRALVAADAAALGEHADQFADEFYATLFDLDPSLRPLFPDELEQQRKKLFDEFSVLIERAATADTPTAVDGLVDRARALGDRHEVYGVEPPMYALVEIALLAALDETVDGFDDDHRAAWSRVYRLVAASMQGH